MDLKAYWSRTVGWLRSHKPSIRKDYQPQIDEEGLINSEAESAEQEPAAQDNQIVVKKVAPMDKSESLEKLQAGFDKLIGQLRGINEHLNRQVAQHEDLMGRMDKLPELMESFPAVVESQKQLTERLFEQLKAAAVKDQQFIDVIEKIPTETAKQTDCLADIDHQLSAAAEADVQMAGSFNRFNETLDKLNQSTVGQTDGIMQMSRTFATSDRYLKYIISRQNKRFVWIFMTALGVCVFTILVLVAIIVLLKQ